jgi:hypothetical protein
MRDRERIESYSRGWPLMWSGVILTVVGVGVLGAALAPGVVPPAIGVAATAGVGVAFVLFGLAFELVQLHRMWRAMRFYGRVAEAYREHDPELYEWITEDALDEP